MSDTADATHGPDDEEATALESTGIVGLDDVLHGGLTPNRLYLVEGTPGAGKTTLALQFLLEGVRRGEPTLYVTLSETKREILAIARGHGWSLDGIDIHEMADSASQSLTPDAQLTMFHPSEFELGETTKAVLADVERSKPRRVVFDSLSEMRLLAQNPLRYRRQILGLKQFFSRRALTVLLLDDGNSRHNDDQLHSIAHGVVRLEQLTTGYGAERRRVSISKMRGRDFRGGFHDFAIRRGGLDVFPRLVASEHLDDFSDAELSSDNAGLNALLRGGLPVGSSTLFLGPAGVGKSTVALQFAVAAAARGQRSAIFIFDETVATLRTRARKLGMPVEAHLATGLITVQQVDPAELSPGEFVAIIRRAVDGTDGVNGAAGRPAKLVMIDSLNGYLHSMPDENFLNAQLHELLTYLSQRGVSTMITVTQSGMIGAMQTPVDTTYLADNVILFRYFEARGHVRRAISVVKKRSGDHERTIREMTFAIGEGVKLGPPLSDFQGVLTGTPTFVGATETLMPKEEATTPYGDAAAPGARE